MFFPSRLIRRSRRADRGSMLTTDHAAPRTRGYQNAVLTLIALMVGVGLVERQLTPGPLSGPASASAQGPGDPDQGGLTNALEQRKIIIAELRTLNAKMERLESKLASGLSVKVTDMPPLKLPPEAKAKPEAGK